MPKLLKVKPAVSLGVVPTHVKFVGGLVPDENGELPRNSDGQQIVLAEMARICEKSPVKVDSAQISIFPGTADKELKELMEGLKALDLKIHLIMMVGGANPMAPEDEDEVVSQLLPSLKAAQQYGAVTVASTSIEEWMNGPEDMDLDEAIAQTVKVHKRAVEESGLLDSSIGSWHIEFLRPGEFKTFTNLQRAWDFVKAMNEALGQDFFKILVDAAHMGDSGFSIEKNQELLTEIGAANHLGIYHASAPTTRGCLSSDDGWIAATLLACANTGTLETVFVELFHHEDEALAGLRALEPGHGIDTTDGRDYTQTVIDGLVDIAHRLNNLQARGFLK